MAIRAYRRPLPNPYPQMGIGIPIELPQNEYEEIFVIMDVPLLELTQKDLALLRGMKIDPFVEVE